MSLNQMVALDKRTYIQLYQCIIANTSQFITYKCKVKSRKLNIPGNTSCQVLSLFAYISNKCLLLPITLDVMMYCTTFYSTGKQSYKLGGGFHFSIRYNDSTK